MHCRPETASSRSGIPLPAHCLALGEAVRFRKRQIIFEMGIIPRCLYYIRSGTVQVLQLSMNAERLILFPIEREHFVCEVRFLAELPLTFQLESLTDTSMIAFSRATVSSLLGSDAEFRRSLFSNIAIKMRSLGDSLLRTAYEDNHARMLRLLKSSMVMTDGTPTVFLTQQELAERLGVHRVTVNRILRRLEDNGRLVVHRKRITLLD